MNRADPMSTDHPLRRLTVLGWLIGLVVGVLAAWVAVSAAGGLAEARDALSQVDLRWLIPAVAFEAGSYFVLGSKIRHLVGPDVLSSRQALGVGLILSGFGPLAPAAPAGGIALSASYLNHRGVPGRRIALILALAEWTSVLVFLLISAVNVIVVVSIERGAFADFWPLVVISVVILIFLAFLAWLATRSSALERVGAWLGLLRRSKHRRPVEERRAAAARWQREAREFLGHPRRGITIGVLTAIAFLGDVACLWCALRGAGADVGFHIALLGISVASVSVLVPFVPGGLGIVEAAIPAVVHRFAIPYDLGLAAVVAYRAISLFLPAGVGSIVVLVMRRSVRTNATEGAG
ncbi:MAG: YbhN family protein [Acidimicrobiia bacterium]